MKTRDIGKTLHPVALLAILAMPALVRPALAMEASATESPEEIIVTGPQSHRQLQARIELAQEHMFGLFNELNDDNRYDIHCFEYVRTGTRIGEHICAPEFLRKSIELNAKAYVAELQGVVPEEGGLIPGSSAHVAVPQAEATYHYPILKEKMTKLVEENAEFAASVAEHHALVEEMNRRDSAPGN